MNKLVIKNHMDRAICEMEYDVNENWIQVKWQGYANLEAIKSWGESYLIMLEETACPYLLNDDSKSSGPWSSAIEWIQTYLLPKAIEKGVRYYAHILSENDFAVLSSRELNSKIAGTLEIGSFNNVKEAKIWLIDMQEKDVKSSQ